MVYMSPNCTNYSGSTKEAVLIVSVLPVLARLAQPSLKLFIKRSAYMKVVGIHNISKILGEKGSENSRMVITCHFQPSLFDFERLV